MTISYHNGIDYFTRDIDKPERSLLYCLACQAHMEEKKSSGPRSWAGAMAGMKSKHWAYHCPNTKYKGHSRLVALYKEAGKFESERLRNIVLAELHEKRWTFLHDEKVKED